MGITLLCPNDLYNCAESSNKIAFQNELLKLLQYAFSAIIIEMRCYFIGCSADFKRKAIALFRKCRCEIVYFRHICRIDAGCVIHNRASLSFLVALANKILAVVRLSSDFGTSCPEVKSVLFP